jgi:pimeloyl-ACP methyl ester carboxylesterase
MVASILFVHSPLVGPSTWATSAELMASHGFGVCVPDLTGVAQASAPQWEVLVDTAAVGAATLEGEVAIVGHSGAGAFLPAIADRLQGRAVSLLVVDCVDVGNLKPEAHTVRGLGRRALVEFEKPTTEEVEDPILILRGVGVSRHQMLTCAGHAV